MIRSDVFKDCGEFYEGYRNGYEDLELCVQLRRRGKKLRCVPASRIFHLESQTPGRKEGDDHNSVVFAERCGTDVYVDVHHHALRDGFSVFISDLLTPLNSGFRKRTNRPSPRKRRDATQKHGCTCAGNIPCGSGAVKFWLKAWSGVGNWPKPSGSARNSPKSNQCGNATWTCFVSWILPKAHPGRRPRNGTLPESCNYKKAMPPLLPFCKEPDDVSGRAAILFSNGRLKQSCERCSRIDGGKRISQRPVTGGDIFYASAPAARPARGCIFPWR